MRRLLTEFEDFLSYLSGVLSTCWLPSEDLSFDCVYECNKLTIGSGFATLRELIAAYISMLAVWMSPEMFATLGSHSSCCRSSLTYACLTALSRL